MLSNQQTPAEAKTHAMLVKTAQRKKSSTGSRFVQDGYSVIRGIWKEGTLETLRKIAKNKETIPIINQNLDDREDNNNLRKMSAPFPRTSNKTIRGNIELGKEKAAMKELWTICDKFAKTINDRWRTFGMVVLRSEIGCHQQAVHMDGILGKPEIGGLVIAVEEGTKLHIGGGLLELNVGEVVAFSGFTPHCGAAYETASNVRFHAYMAAQKNDLPIDKVGTFSSTCSECTKGFTAKRGRKRHLCKHDTTTDHSEVRKEWVERQRRCRANKKKMKLIEEQSARNEE